MKANGIHVHNLDRGGTGDPVVFLAGLDNTAHVFDTLAPKFSNRLHAIGMTGRGFGQEYVGLLQPADRDHETKSARPGGPNAEHEPLLLV